MDSDTIASQNCEQHTTYQHKNINFTSRFP
jgi:hypothetical protein